MCATPKLPSYSTLTPHCSLHPSPDTSSHTFLFLSIPLAISLVQKRTTLLNQCVFSVVLTFLSSAFHFSYVLSSPISEGALVNPCHSRLYLCKGLVRCHLVTLWAKPHCSYSFFQLKCLSLHLNLVSQNKTVFIPPL